jgi:hypothetical protein
LLSVLDDELQRLPDKYSAPLLLCYLEGHTQDEAAHQLGWSPQVLRGRIERGRAVLRRRLIRRGFGPSVVIAGALLDQAPAAVPALLTAQTLRTVMGSFHAPATAVSIHIATLAEAGTKALAATKLKLVVSAVAMLGILVAGLGAGLSSFRNPEPRSPSTAPAVEPPAAQAKSEPRRDRYGDLLPPGALTRFGTVRLRHASGRILAFSADGKTVTSAGSDSALRIWEVASGRLLRKLPGPSLDNHDFRDVLWPTDGATLVNFRSDQPAFVFWDLATGAQRRTLPWDGPRLNAVALSPDGRTPAVAVQDNRPSSR